MSEHRPAVDRRRRLMGQATRASELRRRYRRWMLELWNGDRFAEDWVSSDGLALMGRLGALGPG